MRTSHGAADAWLARLLARLRAWAGASRSRALLPGRGQTLPLSSDAPKLRTEIHESLSPQRLGEVSERQADGVVIAGPDWPDSHLA
jgi:hypothetical protein